MHQKILNITGRSRIPLRICISIRLGRNPALRPLTKPEPGCTDPMGMAPKLVPG